MKGTVEFPIYGYAQGVEKRPNGGTSGAFAFPSVQVLESSKEAKVQMKAPQKPGKYVIRVDVAGRRSAADSASDQEFEVTEAKKSQ